jgi:hypothetical protein
MKQQQKGLKNGTKALFAAAGAFLAAFVAVTIASAFSGPSANPPTGNGALSVSGANVGIGTSTPIGELTVGSGASSLSISTSDVATGGWLRNDGANTVLSTNVGSIFIGYTGNSGKSINIGNGNPGAFVVTGSAPSDSMWIDSSGNVHIAGNLNASGTIVGSYTGTTSAGNISSGEFGSSVGNGNFSFPASVGLGGATSPANTLDVNGNADVQSSLSLGTTTVSSTFPLYVNGSALIGQRSTAQCTGGISLANNFAYMGLNNQVSGNCGVGNYMLFGFGQPGATGTISQGISLNEGANSMTINESAMSITGISSNVTVTNNSGYGFTFAPTIISSIPSTITATGGIQLNVSKVLANSTIVLGQNGSTPGCIEMYDSGGTVNYITVYSGTLSATTTKPSACQ